MERIIVLVHKEVSGELEVHRLKRGYEQKRHDVQRLEPREAQDEKSPSVEQAIRDRVAIFPKENEAADAPEYPDRIRAALVERAEKPIDRQLILNKTHFPVAYEGELTIVE